MERRGGITRRRFLGLLAKAAEGAFVLDTAIAHIPGTNTVSKGFWEAIESGTIGIPAEEYKKKLNDEFKVEILAPSTGISEVVFSPDHKHKTIEWDSPRLKSLIDVLASLPPHFYQPRTIAGTSYRLRFALIDVPQGDRKVSFLPQGYAAFCDCSELSNQLIVVNKANFGQTFTEAKATLKLWVHELTHSLTGPDLGLYADKILKPLNISWQGLRCFFASEFNSDLWPYLNWASEVHPFMVDRQFFEKELGAEFTIFNENLAVRTDFYLMLGEYFFRTFIEKRKPQWEVDYGFRPEMGKENLWEIRLGTGDIFPIQPLTSIGYGVFSFGEFLSEASERYVGGHKFFHRIYDPFLSPNRTEQLYMRIKESIFSGYEYVS